MRIKDEWEACKAGFAAAARFARPYRFILPVNLLICLTGLIAPVLVANRTIDPNPITNSLAFLAFAWLWFNVAQSSFTALRGLYGYPVKPVLEGQSEEDQRRGLPRRIVVSVMLSFTFTVYGFAIAYAFLSNARPMSFNVGELGIFQALYFSLTTIATVGFGDIVPRTSLARLLVMGEILTGILYAIFMFSIVATFVREKR